MRTEALNGLKKGDRVRHKKSSGNNHWYKKLNNGTIDEVSLSGKQVYVRWFDDRGNYHHWAKYGCDALEKIGGESEFIDERCPKCGATLLGNKQGDKWCTNAGGAGMAACDYGLKTGPSEKQIILSLAAMVMGWKRHEDTNFWYGDNGNLFDSSLWNPLQNIADAWMLVDRVEADGWSWCISRLEYGKVEALIGNGSATAKTAQEAISMAIYGVLTKR